MRAPLIVAGAVLLAPSLAGAQLRSASLAVDLRSWSFVDQVTGERQGALQFSYPFRVAVGLRRSLDLQIRYDGTTSAYDPLGERSEHVAGFADLDTHLLYRTADDRLLLTAGFNLPTGKTGLTDDELDVAAVIGHRLVGFRTRRMGRGFDVSGSATYGGAIARGVTCSVGLGFVQRGTYRMRDEDFTPADEASVSIGAGVRNRSRSVLTQWDVTARFFGTDALDGQDAYEQGDRIELQGAVHLRGRRYSGRILALLALQGDDRVFAGSDPAALQAIDFPPGTGFFLRTGPERSLGSAAAGVDLEWNHYSGSDVPQPAADLREDGDLIAVGPAVRFPWSGTSVRTRVLYTFGTIRGRAGETDLDVTGVVVAADLTWLATVRDRRAGRRR